MLGELGIATERWSVEEAATRFPSFDGSDLAWVLHEPAAGVLRAQRAVQALARQAAAAGAEIVRARAVPVGDAVALGEGNGRGGGTGALGEGGAASGTRFLEGDRIVWCAGGWLAKLFPEFVTLRVTRQELFFFDGGPAWKDAPAWVDFNRAMYGTGDLDGLGVKVAWDQEGPPLDPDAELPDATPETEALSRGYTADRFPALAGAPLTGSKCCRYELSSDGHFIAAPHPDHGAVWIVGGGSGHGFKHGPALAERIVNAWGGGAPLPPHFALGDRTQGIALRSAGSYS